MRSKKGKLDKALPYFVLGVFALLYASLSILKHLHFQSHAFDLGIFDQGIWHYSRFEAPASTIRGFDNLLGDHFHPILVLVAPLLWVWNDARALLILQALLFVLSALPIWWLADKHFGRLAAVLWSSAYLLFWGIQNAIAFDFHEIAFAMPLISFGAFYAVGKRWRRALFFILPLLLVKEDLSFLVMAFGLFYLLYRQWWLGLGLVGLGASWFLIVTKLIMPGLAGGNKFGYWTYPQFGPDPISAAKAVLAKPWRVVEEMFQPRHKLKTGFYLFWSFGLLPLASPLIVLAAPLVAERFLSTNMNYWVMDFHYSATIAPILALAAIDGLQRFGRWLHFRRSVYLIAGLAVLLINVYLLPRYPLSSLVQPSYWSLSQSDRQGHAMLELIPPSASVLAQDTIAPHLTHRDKIYDLDQASPKADYVAVNFQLPHFPAADEFYKNYLTSLSDQGYRVAYSQGSWLLYHKGLADGAALSPEAKAYFGDGD
ncbi:MAG TPA: DUF2079 domain-containing protein [Candidatus Saccharimonadales bacterium]|nr:DUF2079 domain-containing protein [Candidatus Saccharimonadales bacterium]